MSNDFRTKANKFINYGEDSSKKATINQGKIVKLQYLLTKGLYSDLLAQL